jgi:UDP-N-acetylglucosamine--N-acetylmuramyl-(pentapeptide) pyrophosphoryl-undecaprenol N-acetylglucosamine transferase
VKKAGYEITHIDMYGLNRKNPFANIKTAYYFFTSNAKAKKLVAEFKPDFVIGTGGYQCYAPLAAAAKAGVYCAVHESNSIPGKAVRMAEKHVNRIYTNFPGVSERLRAKEKVMRVGNPLVSENIVTADESTKEKLGIPKSTKFTFLSFGGSRGAAAINEHMLGFIAAYAKSHPEIYFVHATGSVGYKNCMEKAEQSGILALPNVRITEYIYDMPLWEAAADIVLCRAGAMTISEMALGKKACIFVPSPYVAENHQYMNAKVLTDAGAAMLIEEKDLSPKSIKECAEEIFTQKEKAASLRRNIEKFAGAGAAEAIYKDMQELMSGEIIKNLIKEDAK